MRMDVVLICVSLLIGCGGPPEPVAPPRCTNAEVDLLASMFEAAAIGVVLGGQCDKYEKVEECPSYRSMELAFIASAEAMCRGR